MSGSESGSGIGDTMERDRDTDSGLIILPTVINWINVNILANVLERPEGSSIEAFI